MKTQILLIDGVEVAAIELRIHSVHNKPMYFSLNRLKKHLFLFNGRFLKSINHKM